MSTITFLLMMFVAFLLYSAGQVFFAFILLVLALLLLLTTGDKSQAPGEAGASGGPIVVHGGQNQYPSSFRFQPDWKGPSSGEAQVGGAVGDFVNFVGSSTGHAIRFFFGEKKEE